MSQVKMDMSEYEILMENKRLLEKSLDKERELRDQIDVLRTEKVQALEGAKMKVVRVERKEVTEHMLVTENTVSLWSELCNIVRSMCYGGNVDEYMVRSSCIGPDGHPDFTNIIERLFKRTTSYSQPEESVTTVGLDEVRKELKEEAERELSVFAKCKLDEAETYLKEKETYLKYQTELNTEVGELKSKNRLLADSCKKLGERLDELEKEGTLLAKIKKIASAEGGWLQRTVVLGRIKSLLK